jgi:hypothetical protein
MTYFCFMKQRAQLWVLAILLLLSSAAQAQRFQLEHDDYSDSIVWYVRNASTNWVKPVSLTINWFHTKPNLYVWDATPGPASSRNRITEINKNGNLTFRYKSTQGIGINDTIYAGQRIPVFYSVNYNTKKTDTIMPANCILFYHDSLNSNGEEPVLPKGASCDYKRVFLNSYSAASGIHFKSQVWYTLHEDICQKYGTIQNLFVMVVFDQSTFLPTSAGVIPKCPSGRYGTAFGYPKDSQIYYSFTLSDSKHIDSIINGITDGDYVALVSYPTFSQSTISQMKSRFAPIGLNTDSLIVGPFGNPDVQMVFWGRKGIATNKGKLNTVGRFYKGPASIANLSADHVMIAKQSEDELLAWPPCFETLAVVHQPYIPAPVKVGTATQGLKRSVSAVPNPTTHEIHLGVADYSVDWHFRDAAGRLVMSAQFTQGSEMTITVSSLSPGMYFGEAKTDTLQERTHWRTQFIKID